MLTCTEKDVVLLSKKRYSASDILLGIEDSSKYQIIALNATVPSSQTSDFSRTSRKSPGVVGSHLNDLLSILVATPDSLQLCPVALGSRN